jgi:hypothetical protein
MLAALELCIEPLVALRQVAADEPPLLELPGRGAELLDLDVGPARPSQPLPRAGPDSGPGAAFSWKGKEGAGSQTISSAEPNRQVVMQLDLGAMGMPGCTLYVSGDALLSLLNWGGQAAWAITVPLSPSLRGLRFFNQVAVLDTQNAFGMVASNAGTGLVGDL